MSGFWKPVPVARYTCEEIESSDFVIQASFERHRAPIAQQRLLLPIYKYRKLILYSLEHYQVIVIVGDTGSGKSTQLPQYCMENGWTGNDFSIVCTQPRRIAATTLARRVAMEVGCPIGARVGYSVRFDSQIGSQINYVTDGMLLREATLADPLLSKYSVVIVDEAHERSLDSDAILGLLKKICRKRKDLRIIVCSATIDAQIFLDFFVGPQASIDTNISPKKSRWGEPLRKTELDKAKVQTWSASGKGTIISVAGRQYPVDILYLALPAQNYILKMIETLLAIHRGDNTMGDILCFLASAEDIDQAIQITEEELEHQLQSVELLPLYGTLPYYMQARVYQEREGNAREIRRMIFATNIAECSVTVPNISHVIDSGLVKLPYFDPIAGLERLIVGPISQASARQRAGRAGRLRAGKCYRLFKENYYFTNMKADTQPEILRTNLTAFILTLKALGVDNLLAFDLLDVPSVDAISHGLESLYALGAIDEATHMTKLGNELSAFPTDPRISRMLLESLAEKCAWEVLGLAAALQVRNILQPPRGRRHPQAMIDYENAVADVADPTGDHVTYVNCLAEMEDGQWSEQDCKERFMNYLAMKRALEIRKQLAGVLKRFGKISAMGIVGDDGQVRSRAIRRCVTAGFFFNIAKLGNDGRYYTLRKSILVVPSPNSIYSSHCMGGSEYIIFGQTVDGSRGGIELRCVSSIEARWLNELAPHYWASRV
ncbi:hypothetical protein MPSEU_000205000 [Mayamaea pseudoterrestris]|nr:hypothetical protein MPSEU_000205000 [Mayamaea pseudoterrestris]